jgi:hypothetical protein
LPDDKQKANLKWYKQAIVFTFVDRDHRHTANIVKDEEIL